MRKPCCDKKDTTKGAWSRQEDQKLIDYIKAHGEGCWGSLPKAAGLHRCGKSCRLRWINYLRPDLKHGNFGLDEENLIIRLHSLLGNRWSLIAGRLPGRTDNEVKNYWNSHIRKKLISMGIDPNNHRLELDHALPADPASMSSGSMMTNASDNNSLKPDPLLSDSSSGLEEEEEISASLDLNLDLTIAIPASSVMDVIDKKRQDDKSLCSREVDDDSNPTLLLFK